MVTPLFLFMGKLIYRVEIPRYLKKVKICEKRAAKSFIKNKGPKLPKKYCDESKYEWKESIVRGVKREKLYIKDTSTPVISNPLSAGTPGFQVVSGNAILSGNMHPHVRATVFDALKEEQNEYIQHMPVIDIPVDFVLEVHDTADTEHTWWDIDNRGVCYTKTILDTLTGNRGKWEAKIKGDDIRYLRSVKTVYVPVATTEERKLVVSLYETKDYKLIKWMNEED